ncbi:MULTISPECIES: hypothetical protein [Bacillus cereus group]|uniref:Uncharacterized protein n=1 Tax=Bacillus thuringiensis TaxID=1428 RepID=A0A1C4E520_BACTU|nr:MULTISPECIES: hypothetical protein [Bacillus cereus group]MBE7099717.1 hypothetical protein [Bacillus cereus]MED3025694.1 hypothetical protein [Bacillus wiedmannii]OUB59160.1 hypothetical protein BK743_13320 [Bacillus thuringiensis serovar sylvestriensis]SCC38708.1 Protein of unknown function [Bacillus thuringiensis]
MITIPSLIIIIAGIVRMLISQRFEKYKTGKKVSLKHQYITVNEDVSQKDESKDKAYLVAFAFVSVLGFLNQVFQQGNFDKNPTCIPIINKYGLLHGRDTPNK